MANGKNLWDERPVAIEELRQTVADIPCYVVRQALRRALLLEAFLLGICPRLIVPSEDDGGTWFANFHDHLGRILWRSDGKA